MKSFFQVAALLAATFLILPRANAQSSTRSAKTWRVFPVSSLQKLTAKTPGVLQPFSSQPVELQAARGEWESFQVVVSASDKPLRFSVAATSFATQLGRFIARDNVQIFRENYVQVTHPSGNRVLDSRWWPDALIPLNDKAVFEVAANRSVVLWVAVRVPRDAEAGQYFAALDVVPQITEGAKTSKLDATPREVPLALNVSPAVLPSPTMRANVAVYYDSLRDWYGKNVSSLNDEQFVQLKKNYYGFLLDYGLNAYDLPVAWNSAEAANYLRDARVRSVRLPPQDSPEFDVALQQLKSTDALAKAYAYRIDEPSPEQYAAVRTATTRLHEANAQLKHCVTVAPNETLRGAVDIWCPNIGDFFGLGHLDMEALKRERQSGRETWWYTMVEPKSPYPTWLLDDDASAVRVYGWIMARHDISGFVYSMAHGWGPKPLENLESFEGTN
ncbi:MAG TPA: glycoside hydrolase domain-containing protein, partial [Abditibacteriaceae bacterium]|nr:glycoside hydrolase domain-containing protein [Abditibacteriaceae bacterium]